MKRLEVGDKIYFESKFKVNPREIKECSIVKVGRKYLEVDYNSDYKIEIDSLKYTSKVYSQNNIQFYRTRGEIEDKNELSKLHEKLKKHFYPYSAPKNTLEELRTIALILGL